jgi:hypothetical protein
VWLLQKALVSSDEILTEHTVGMLHFFLSFLHWHLAWSWPTAMIVNSIPSSGKVQAHVPFLSLEATQPSYTIH